ncbi:hypothetical protein SANTM175S_05064 [Streptomyces antimycoticus]
MPPSEQWLCVEGLGPNFSRWAASRRLSSSSTMPGSTTQVRRSVSTDTSRSQYFVQSMTTAALVHWPPRLVPPPRLSTGSIEPGADRDGLGSGLHRAVAPPHRSAPGGSSNRPWIRAPAARVDQDLHSANPIRALHDVRRLSTIRGIVAAGASSAPAREGPVELHHVGVVQLLVLLGVTESIECGHLGAAIMIQASRSISMYRSSTPRPRSRSR